jgi:hypothetical protein
VAGTKLVSEAAMSTGNTNDVEKRWRDPATMRAAVK